MFARHFLKYQIKPQLTHLILHVTGRCNLRCRHCFVDFEQRDEMTLEQFQLLAQQIGKIAWLDIAGGEPFLRDDLSQIVAAFDCDIVQIPTNGILADKMLQQIKSMQANTKAQLVISLSLDGLETTHDAIRGKPGHYQQVWQTFKQLRQIQKLPVKINTVLTRDNQDQIIPLMKEVRRHDPDFHSIILLRGEPNDPQMALPTIAELEALTPQIFKIWQSYDYGKSGLMARILANYHRYLWRLSIKTLKTQRQPVPCLAGLAHMVVWANGDLAGCEMLPPVGNLNQASFDQIIQSPKMIAQRRAIKQGACACTHNCALFDSIMLRPASIPQLLYQPMEPES